MRDLALAAGGPLYRFYLRTHLSVPSMALVHRRILAVLVIGWIPLWVLAAVDRLAPSHVTVSFLHDLDAHLRFLVALPLLMAGEAMGHQRIRILVRRFIDRRLIAPDDLRRFAAAVASGTRLMDSWLLEVVVLVLAVVAGHWVWVEQITLHVPTWYGTPGADGVIHLTAAGYWYVFISLPLLRFLLLRWYVRLFLVWYRFVWTIARIPLRLNALHPDRSGGLGFLDASLLAFLPVLVAQSVVLSSAIAQRIWTEGGTLAQFQMVIFAAIAFLMLIVMLPQLFFAVQLERAWRVGLGAYGTFAARYAREFGSKWLETTRPPHDPLGSADIQSLADSANAFQVVAGMNLVPITRRTVQRLAVAIAAPFLPLVLTVIPVHEIVTRAAKLLL
jgi:hypothetical protein